MRVHTRYAAYCYAQGMRPKQVFARDKELYPGGLMCGYILWISDKWDVFCKEYSIDRNRGKTEKEHALFNAWLWESLK